MPEYGKSADPKRKYPTADEHQTHLRSPAGKAMLTLLRAAETSPEQQVRFSVMHRTSELDYAVERGWLRLLDVHQHEGILCRLFHLTPNGQVHLQELEDAQKVFLRGLDRRV